MSIRRFFLFLFFSCLLSSLLFSQTVKDLEAQKTKMLEDLSVTTKLLNETKKSTTSSENKLSIIRQTISSRKSLIDNLSLQINVLDQNMDTLKLEKARLSQRLFQLKGDYARLLQEAQMRKNSYSPLLFLFSSESIGQAYRRLRYLQESSSYRKKQAIEIQLVQQKIEDKQMMLSQALKSKETVLSQKEQEKQQLQKEQSKENQSLVFLRTKRKELQTQLTKQQKQANELNRRIEQAILDEMRREEARRRAQQAREAAAAKKAAEQAAREAARQVSRKEKKQKPTTQTSSQEVKTTPVVIAKPVAPTYNVDMMTKEETLTAGNFEANKGRLPWPVEKGFIRGHFGVQPHPVLKHVTTNNKGIYIQTPRNSEARSIFEGVVTQRFAIPGNNNAIIIKHGNYRTVYANLTTIYVKEGDHVSARQKIGKIFVDDENDGKTELYMMLWHDKTLLNPEQWLSR